MSTIQPNGSPSTPTSTKNNGGAVIAGSVSRNMKSIGFVQPDVGVFGSAVVEGVNAVNPQPLGVFNYNNNRPVAMKTTSNLAAINNNFLLSGANDPDSIKSINYMVIDKPTGLGDPEVAYIDGTKTTRTASAIRENKLNIYTGKFDSGYPGTSDDYFLGVDNASGDKAAKVTRLVPGSLVYKLSKKPPVSQNYAEKTG